MPASFTITAALQLQAPSNLSQVASQIQKSLRGISADINLKLSSGATNGLNNLNSRLDTLQKNLRGVTSEAGNASAAMTKLANVFNIVRGVGTSLETGLGRAADGIRTLGRGAKEAASGLDLISQQSGLAARRLVAFGIAATAIGSITIAFKSGLTSALEFEQGMANLAAVSNNTADQVKGVGQEITRLAQAYGVSSKELLDTSVSLKQAGLNVDQIAGSLEGLSKASLSPNFGGLKDAAETMVTVFKQFDGEVSRLEGHLGSINAVAGSFGVEAKDIASAIQKTGSVFKSAGGDLNEFISIFASVKSTTRESADSIASSLRTVFAKLQKSDTIEQLHKLGIELQYTSEEATNLGKTDLSGQFVGAAEAVRRLSQGLAGLKPSDSRFSDILGSIGGAREVGKIIPLLQGTADAQKALNVAQAGSVSLQASSEKAQSSLLNRTAQLREQFLGLARSVADSSGFQSFAKIMLDGASVAIKLADALKPLIPLLAALTVGKTLASIGTIARGATGQFTQSPAFTASQKRGFARGGVVPGSGTGDTVPAMLEPNEFVIRKDSAQKIGYAYLHQLNEGKHPRRQKYANGGDVTLTRSSRGDDPVQTITASRPYRGKDKYYASDTEDFQRNILPGFNVKRQLSKEEREALYSYTQGNHDVYNGFLRDKNPVDAGDLKTIGAITRATNIGRLPEKTTLYRGITEAQVARLESIHGFSLRDRNVVGKSFRDKAPQSFSSDIHVADSFASKGESEGFGSGLIFRYVTGKNDRGHFLGSDSTTSAKEEHETLLPPRSGFRIVGVEGNVVSVERLATGGLVRRFADGGLVRLAKGGSSDDDIFGDIFSKFPGLSKGAKAPPPLAVTPTTSETPRGPSSGKLARALNALWGNPVDVSPKEARAVQGYVRTSEEINRTLTGSESLLDPQKSEILGRVNTITKAIKRSPLPADLVTYRGVDPVIAQKMAEKLGVDSLRSNDAIGKVYNAKEFLSTSTNIDEAKKFTRGNRGHLLEIRTKEGRKGLPLDSTLNTVEHNELLLQRGGKFRIVQQQADRTVLEQLAKGGLVGHYASGGIVTAENIQAILKEFQEKSGIDFSKVVKKISVTDSQGRLKGAAFDGPGSKRTLGVFENSVKEGKLDDNRIILNKAAIKDEATLRRVLAHELGHAVDLYQGVKVEGQKNFSSNLPGSINQAYAQRKKEATKTDDLIRRNNFSDKYSKYRYSNKESFAETFADHLVGGDSLFSKIGRLGFQRNVVDDIARSTNKNFQGREQKGLFGKIAGFFGFARGGQVPTGFSSPLTENDIEALRSYTSSSSGKNSVLRRQEAATNVGMYNFRGITRAIDKASLAEDTTLHRGVGLDAVAEIERQLGVSLDSHEAIGKIFRDPAFVSTSRSETVARDFANPLSRKIDPKQLLTILAEKGSKAADVASISEHPHEEEVTLQRGSRFRVLGKDNDRVILDLLPPDIRKSKFAKGGESTDTIPALLTPGEFVFNANVVREIGKERLHRMNRDGIRGFARGGFVGLAKGGDETDGVHLSTDVLRTGSVDPSVLAAVEAEAKKIGVALSDVSKVLVNFTQVGKEITSSFAGFHDPALEKRRELVARSSASGHYDEPTQTSVPLPANLTDSQQAAYKSLEPIVHSVIRRRALDDTRLQRKTKSVSVGKDEQGNEVYEKQESSQFYQQALDAAQDALKKVVQNPKFDPNNEGKGKYISRAVHFAINEALTKEYGHVGKPRIGNESVVNPRSRPRLADPNKAHGLGAGIESDTPDITESVVAPVPASARQVTLAQARREAEIYGLKKALPEGIAEGPSSTVRLQRTAKASGHSIGKGDEGLLNQRLALLKEKEAKKYAQEYMVAQGFGKEEVAQEIVAPSTKLQQLPPASSKAGANPFKEKAEAVRAKGFPDITVPPPSSTSPVKSANSKAVQSHIDQLVQYPTETFNDHFVGEDNGASSRRAAEAANRFNTERYQKKILGEAPNANAYDLLSKKAEDYNAPNAQVYSDIARAAEIQKQRDLKGRLKEKFGPPIPFAREGPGDGLAARAAMGTLELNSTLEAKKAAGRPEPIPFAPETPDFVGPIRPPAAKPLSNNVYNLLSGKDEREYHERRILGDNADRVAAESRTYGLDALPVVTGPFQQPEIKEKRDAAKAAAKAKAASEAVEDSAFGLPGGFREDAFGGFDRSTGQFSGVVGEYATNKLQKQLAAGPVSTLTKSQAASDQGESVRQQVIAVEKALLQEMHTNISAFEAMRVATQNVKDAEDGLTTIVRNTKGDHLGTGKTVNAALDQGIDPNAVGPTGRLGRLLSLAGNRGGFLGKAANIANNFGVYGASIIGGYAAAGADAIAGDVNNRVLADKETGGDGNTTRYKTAKTIGGTLQGAAIGLTVGAAFGPWGAAIGAGAGALYGFVSSLKEATESIRDAKIGLAITTLGDKLDVLSANPGNALAAQQGNEAIQTIRTEGSEKATKEATHFFTGFDASEYSALNKKELRSNLAGQLPGIVGSLNTDAERAGKNKSPKDFKEGLDDLTKTFLDGRQGLNRAMVETVASLRGVSVSEAVKGFIEVMKQSSDAARTAKERDKTNSDVFKVLSSVERFALALEAATASVAKLENQADTLSQLFEGKLGSTRVINQTAGLASLGAPGQGKVFAESVSSVTGPLGQSGEQVKNVALALDKVERVLPSVLTSVLGSNPVDKDSFSAQTGNRLNTLLPGADDDTKKVINAISTRLGEMKLDDIEKAIQQDVSKLVPQLTQDFRSVIDVLGRFNKELGGAQNKFIDGLTASAQRTAAIGQEKDRGNFIGLGQTRFQAEEQAIGAGRRGSGLDFLSLAQLQQPLVARQQRLVGPGNEGVAENAAGIGGLLEGVEGKIRGAEEAQQKASQGGDQKAFAAAAEQLSKLKESAVNYQTALRHLTDVTERNSAIQEKLNAIQANREGRLAFNEKYLTSSPDEKLKTQTGFLLLNQAKQQGSFNGFTDEQIRLAADAKNSAPNVKAKAWDDQTPTQVFNQLLEKSGGIAQPKDEKAEEEKLKLEMAKNFKEAAEAQGRLVKSMETNNDKLIKGLHEVFDYFLNQQKINLASATVTDRENQLASKQGDLTQAKKVVDARKVFEGIGIDNDNKFSAYKNSRSDIDLIKSGREAADDVRTRTGELASSGSIDRIFDTSIGEKGKRYGYSFAANQSVTDRLAGYLSSEGGFKDVDKGSLNTRFVGQLNKTIGERGLGGTDKTLGDEEVQAAVKEAIRRTIEEYGAAQAGYAYGSKAQVAENRLKDKGLDVEAIKNQLSTPEGRKKLDDAFAKIDDSKLDFSKIGANLDKANDAVKDWTAVLIKSRVDLATAQNAPNPELTGRIEQYKGNVPGSLNAVGSLVSGLGGLFNRASPAIDPSNSPFDDTVYQADGGSIFKSKGSDTVPAMLTPDEFVVNRDSARANASLLKEINDAKGPLYRAGGGWADDLPAGFGPGGGLDADIQRRQDAEEKRKKDFEEFRIRNGLAPRKTDPENRDAARDRLGLDENAGAGVIIDRPAAPVNRGLAPPPAIPDAEARGKLGLEDEGQTAVLGLGAKNQVDRLKAGIAYYAGRGRTQQAPAAPNAGGEVDPETAALRYQAAINPGGNSAKYLFYKQASAAGLSDDEAGIISLRRQQAIAAQNITRQGLLGRSGGSSALRPRPGAEGQANIASGLVGYAQSRNEQANRLDFKAREAARRRTNDQEIPLPVPNGFRGGYEGYYADGGMVGGHGVGDSVPAMLAPGEFVLNRAATQRAGVGNLQHFNDGGVVQPNYLANNGGSVGSPSIDFAPFIGGVQTFAAAVNTFAPQMNSLTQALTNFPSSLKIEGRTQVDIILNGAEVLTRIMPGITEIIGETIERKITQALQQVVPDAGRPTFDK